MSAANKRPRSGFHTFVSGMNVSESITLTVRDMSITIPKTHPIFSLSTVLKGTLDFGSHFVNANPYCVQVLIDYAECYDAAQSGDPKAQEIQQEMLSKIYSDGDLQWTVHALNMDLGAEKVDTEWSLDESLSIDKLGVIVDFDADWTYTQAVVIIALLLKQHEFPEIVVEVGLGKEGLYDDSGNECRQLSKQRREDNMISPSNGARNARLLPKALRVNDLIIRLGSESTYNDRMDQSRTISFSVVNEIRVISGLNQRSSAGGDQRTNEFMDELQKYLLTYEIKEMRHW
jgi:hypothetical protein